MHTHPDFLLRCRCFHKYVPTPTTVARVVIGIATITALFAPRVLAQTPAPATSPSSIATRHSSLPTGRIQGRVTDARSGDGISGVAIQVVGTTRGTTSGIDGRFAIAGIDAGTVTLHLRRLGYTPQTVSGLQLDADQSLEQAIALEPLTIQLQGVTVSAGTAKGSVDASLDRQRNAAGVVSAVTAEQIAKSADSDAAQAAQRVSGVTVQDGRYLAVRGLGERYTTASLNGARLPSPEPERKVVPLDLFPSGLLQSVTTTKTFTPEQPGDFAGASVDIRTRDYPAQRQVVYSTSLGMSAGATGRNVFYAPGSVVRRSPWLERAKPAGRPACCRQFPGPRYPGRPEPLHQLTAQRLARGQPNGRAEQFVRAVGRRQRRRTGPRHRLPRLRHVHVLAGTARPAGPRARAARLGGRGDRDDRFTGTTGRNSTLWGGLLNLGTMVGSRNRLSLNNTYNRTADQDARVESGSIERYGASIDVQRLDYVERSMYSSQLAGEHDLDRQRVEWSLTASGVTRDEPDRSELVYQHDVDPSTGTKQLLWLEQWRGERYAPTVSSTSAATRRAPTTASRWAPPSRHGN